MYKNTASQKWTVFAFDRTDNAPKTGDAGQISAVIRIDGAENVVDDVHPTELTLGYYEFDITQAETNGDLLTIIPTSSTANIQVVGVPGSVYTNAVKAVVDDILTDTSELQVDDIPGMLATIAGYIDTEVQAIKDKTDNLPSGIAKNVALSNFEFLMIDATDHVSAKTGLTITAQISKDGGAFAACTNSAIEISNGLYKINLTQAEMNVDIITLKFTATGADQRTITIITS